MRALGERGPCPEHRRSFVNVSSVTCGDKGPQVICGDPGDDVYGDAASDVGGVDHEAAWSDAGQEN
jgi:hypothetical protein